MRLCRELSHLSSPNSRSDDETCTDGQMFKSVHKIVRAGQSKAFSEPLVKGQKESNLCPCQGQA